jgi:hypothetical protein
MLHRTLHSPILAAASVEGASSWGAQTAQARDASLKSLFDHHQDRLSCQSLDQLCHAQSAPVWPSLAALPLPRLSFEAAYDVWIAERLQRIFQARGPPIFS